MSIEKTIEAIRACPDDDLAVRSVSGFYFGSTDDLKALEAECRELREALENLCTAISEMINDSRGVFGIAAVHGCRYVGREVSLELREAQAVLDKHKQEAK